MSKQQVSRKRPTFPNHRDKTIRKQRWRKRWSSSLVFSTFRFKNYENPEPFLLNFSQTRVRPTAFIWKFSSRFFRCRNKVWWFANWRRSWGCGWGGRASRCSNKWKFCTTRTSIWRERSPYFATRLGWVCFPPLLRFEKKKKDKRRKRN